MAVLVAAGGLVGVALLTPGTGSGTDFSIYNTGWNGTSRLAATAYGADGAIPAFRLGDTSDRVTVTQQPFIEYATDPEATGLLIVGPSVPPAPAEQAWLQEFVGSGGRLVLADDFGEGNAFLEALGSESRFTKEPLRSRIHQRGPAFPISSSLEGHPITHGVDEVILNHAAAIEPAESATVLGRTDATAWLDGDRNGRMDPDEPSGRIPWLTAEPVGEGTIILLSDPSVLINGMREAGDNARLAEGMTAWLSEGERHVLIDEHHHGAVGAQQVTARFEEPPGAVRWGLAAAGGLLFLAFASPGGGHALRRPLEAIRRILMPLFPPPRAPPPEPDVRAEVLRRNPAWEAHEVDRIVAAWEQRQENRTR